MIGVYVKESGRRTFTRDENDPRMGTTSERYKFEVAMIRAGWHTFCIPEDDGGCTILWGKPA